MSIPNNVTSLSSMSPPTSLLWIPYVLIALLFIVFLGANFWCYHRKHRERYLRKRDEKRVKDGLHERRRITALMRSHFQSAFMSKHNAIDAAEDVHDAIRDTGCRSCVPGIRQGAVDGSLSPGQSVPAGCPPWSGQYGACRVHAGLSTEGGCLQQGRNNKSALH